MVVEDLEAAARRNLTHLQKIVTIVGRKIT